MSEPIKVSRAQWDEWFVRFCDDVRPLPSTIYDSDEMDLLRERFARIVGCPRPAPDTPPALKAGPYVTALVDEGRAVYVDCRDLSLLLPWVEDHLLPWLRAQTEEDR